jgi:hypothetical protein
MFCWLCVIVYQYSETNVMHFLFSLLTVAVRVEYVYSPASHASCPGGALLLRDFHKVLKWAGMVDFKV